MMKALCLILVIVCGSVLGGMEDVMGWESLAVPYKRSQPASEGVERRTAGKAKVQTFHKLSHI